MIPVLEHRGMVREVSSREGMWVWTGQKPGSLESEVKTIKKMLREEWIQKHLIFSSICFIRRLQMCLKLRCLYLNVPLSKYSSPLLDSRWIHAERKHFVYCSVFSHVQLFVTPRTAAPQASLFFSISRSLLKLVSIESVIPSTISSSVH